MAESSILKQDGRARAFRFAGGFAYFPVIHDFPNDRYKISKQYRHLGWDGSPESGDLGLDGRIYFKLKTLRTLFRLNGVMGLQGYNGIYA